MAKDIAPELIEKVQKAFTKKYQSSPKIKGELDVINKGEATYKNASAFAEEVGDLLAKTFQEEIGKENLPDGRMYYNIADRLLNNTLGKNYDLISSYTKDTQKVLNEKAGIGVKPAVPEINQSRIDHMVDRIAEEEDYDKIKWMLDEPVTNFSMSVVDDFIKKNVKLHYDMGLHPKIVRKENGKCCDWCDEVVGSYSYPDDVPEDVYKRHRYCRCTVEYFPGDRKKQDIWSEKWEDVDREEKIQARKDLERQKEYKELTGDEVSKAQEVTNKWHLTLSKKEGRALRDYTSNGYMGINQGLRESGGKNISPQVQALDSALDKYHLLENTKFFRGMGVDEVSAFESGNPIYEFKSLSASFDIADDFRKYQVGNEGGEVVIFNVPKGAKGAYIGTKSANPGEQEFILGREQPYTVRRVKGILEVTIHEKD